MSVENIPAPVAENIQDGEDILYVWQGLPERRHKPFLNERGQRILVVLWMLATGIFLGWVIFVSDQKLFFLVLMIAVMIGQPIVENLVRGTYKNLYLSSFPIAVVTDRRVMCFDAKNDRVGNIPLNDFSDVSEDYDNGAKIIRLHTGEKKSDVVFYNKHSSKLLEKLRPIVMAGA